MQSRATPASGEGAGAGVMVEYYTSTRLHPHTEECGMEATVARGPLVPDAPARPCKYHAKLRPRRAGVD